MLPILQKLYRMPIVGAHQYRIPGDKSAGIVVDNVFDIAAQLNQNFERSVLMPCGKLIPKFRIIERTIIRTICFFIKNFHSLSVAHYSGNGTSINITNLRFIVTQAIELFQNPWYIYCNSNDGVWTEFLIRRREK